MLSLSQYTERDWYGDHIYRHVVKKSPIPSLPSAVCTFGRRRIVALSLFLFLLCGPHCIYAGTDQSAEDSEGTVTVSQIVDIWRLRQDHLRTLTIKWDQQEIVMKGMLPRPPDGESQQPAEDAVIPPSDVTLTGEFSLTIDGEKMRYVEDCERFSDNHNAQYRQRSTRVYDGQQYLACFPKGTGDFPIGEIQPETHALAVTHERNVVPIRLAYRILSSAMGGVEPSMLRLEPMEIDVLGRSCRLVRVELSQGRRIDLYVDPSRGYLPVRQTFLNRGSVLNEWTIESYLQSADSWVPQKWRYSELDKAGNLVRTLSAEVTSYSLNEPVAPSSFTIDFPEGTWVYDNVNDREYIIQHSGHLRDVPSGVGLARYEWLMDPANNGRDNPFETPARNRPKTLTLVVVNLALLLAVAVFVLWRRKRAQSRQ